MSQSMTDDSDLRYRLNECFLTSQIKKRPILKVLHTIGTTSRDAGGPPRSSQGLVAGLEKSGVTAWLLSFTPGDTHWVEGVIHHRAAKRAGFFGIRESIGLIVRDINPELMHIHGIWGLDTHVAVSIARKNKIPYVMAPRGMLEPWSLNAKKWKKSLAMWLYQRRDLQGAVALHATALSEAKQFRRLGFKQPIIISPNGVCFPGNMPPRLRREDGKRMALFLSRIHPKKGLIELVEAWGRIKGRIGDKKLDVTSLQSGGKSASDLQPLPLLNWHFEYAGPDYAGHLPEVQQRMRMLGVENDFSYLGALNDTEKWAAYKRADLFILPTYSENFGIVVAEALAAGVPVLTTRGTPWKVLCEEGCGWWIETGLESLIQTLPDVLEMSSEQLAAMGECGRRYAWKAFSWDAIAVEMKHAYEWILGRTEKPDCVTIE